MTTFRTSGYTNMATQLEHSPDPDPRDLATHDLRAREIRADHSLPGELRRRFGGAGLAALGSERYELEQAALLYQGMAEWRETAPGTGSEQQRWRAEAAEMRQHVQRLTVRAASAQGAGLGQITTTTDVLGD